MCLPLALLGILCLIQPATSDNRIVVVTVATENTDGLARLLRSAAQNHIDIKVLGLGQEWNGGDTRTQTGGGQKITILREALEEYKEDTDTIVVFSDAYDVIWTDGVEVAVERFREHFGHLRVLFGAEPYCWPDVALAAHYPLVQAGKRFLNSGLFMGFAPEVSRLLSLKEVADNDDDQLYFTNAYLDENLRKELRLGLDSISRIFQNLNGVVDDISMQFDETTGEAKVYNEAYHTYPVVVHGNGDSKLFLNYLANYVGEWNSLSGCHRCSERIIIEKEQEETAESLSLPFLTLAVFISKPTPFVEEVLAAISNQDYPKAKMHLFIYNNQPFSIDLVNNWAAAGKGEFASRQVINNDGETTDKDARQLALDATKSRGSEFLYIIDADCYLFNSSSLRSLVAKSLHYETDIISPVLNQPEKLFSNFWGALSENGYYARSEDYIPIVQGKRRGVWNVPFISSPLLLTSSLVSRLHRPFHYSKELDADMSFALYARHSGHFMYVNNEDYDGFLVISDDFSDELQKGHLHPELWQIFSNRYLWEKRYVHEDYRGLLEGGVEDVPQPCPDVYDFALVSERFCSEIVGEMEHFGQWSSGTNYDRRLTGGYENVPTRDIHMNQIEYEREWLFFMDEYVRPMQEKLFIGYFHKPVESNMMFVVRYKPDEQASLRPHHDASTFSIDIALNKKGVDFEGGGVRYVRYNCTVPADEVGHTMMFPGRLTHLHEGLPTTEGTRYILVSFINPEWVGQGMRPSLGRAVDVVVVGAGHAGCEAATAAARAGASTLLLTHSKRTIGEMSCNPSFGGIGKGQLMREVDALDGVCSRLADQAAITFQALNRSHGPAVIGLRAQIDRKLYKKYMQEEILEKTKNLEVVEGSVEDVVIEQSNASGSDVLTGVVLSDGSILHTKSLVIATGTFLGAEIFRGTERIAAGRIGEKSATGLSLALKRLKLRLGKLRTGTPPRLLASSINFTPFTLMPPDSKPIPFSFMTKEIGIKTEHQLPTYLGRTNEEVCRIVQENLHLNAHIRGETNGPRYCPSLEAKVIRFPHLNHRMFLEHEGLDREIIYPQGMSMTFDLPTQRDIFRCIPGMEKVEIVQQGYGVQYEFVDPKQLLHTLQVKTVRGLYLAGQINGTTGYEEAAVQGAVAGTNAAAHSRGEEGLEISRTEALVGVLIDDLATLGTNEPYRMFTSRAEMRVHLRADNADMRLTEKGRRMGVVGDERWNHFTAIRRSFDESSSILEGERRSVTKWTRSIPSLKISPKPDVLSGLDLMYRHGVSLSELSEVLAPPRDSAPFQALPPLRQWKGNEELEERLRVHATYAVVGERMKQKMEEVQREAATALLESLDYSSIQGLSMECMEKLDRHRPLSLAAATRIQGVTPEAIIILLRHVKSQSTHNQSSL